jgi:hypothetical protein
MITITLIRKITVTQNFPDHYSAVVTPLPAPQRPLPRIFVFLRSAFCSSRRIPPWDFSGVRTHRLVQTPTLTRRRARSPRRAVYLETARSVATWDIVSGNSGRRLDIITRVWCVAWLSWAASYGAFHPQRTRGRSDSEMATAILPGRGERNMELAIDT